MSEKPIIECEIDKSVEDRVARIDEVDAGAVVKQVPVLLEDTGDDADLESARAIVAKKLLVKIIKGAATADEIARYNALKQ